jgi:hypothetical protein
MGVLKSLARKVGVGAARLAKKGITGALDSASEALERAVFGTADKERRKEEPPPDPFAELKEKQRKESGKVR